MIKKIASDFYTVEISNWDIFLTKESILLFHPGKMSGDSRYKSTCTVFVGEPTSPVIQKGQVYTKTFSLNQTQLSNTGNVYH